MSFAIRAIALVVLLAGCASPAMAPELSLHDRFVLTALTHDDGSAMDHLWRFEWPIQVDYHGPDEYRRTVTDQLKELGQITGLPIEMDSAEPSLYVEISNRDTGYTCSGGNRMTDRGWQREVHIDANLRPGHIRHCIVQEMTQALGVVGDLDGVFASRQDTVFASYGGGEELTPADRQVLQIFYSPRLYSGMPRRDVLAVLPEIAAEVEAEQEAPIQ